MEIKIQHDQNTKQFFVDIDGKIAKLNYKVLPDNKTLDYYSTFVPPELRGQKLADRITLFALDYARQNHYKIIPTCPFVKTLLTRHPEYQDLVK